MKKILIILITIFINFTVSAETKTFGTITDALNYDGDRDVITHLIITDSISGENYSIGSEWREIRSLDKTFKNLSELTLHTDQDIPDSGWDGSNLDGQFMGGGPFGGARWLKKFTANNIKRIGRDAFMYCLNLTTISFNSVEVIGLGSFTRCENLISADFPSAITVEGYAFAYCTTLVSINFPVATTLGTSSFNYCWRLTEINFPLVTAIGQNAFLWCLGLRTASFGTGFETETKIVFEPYVFNNSDTLTKNIELTLGEYVLPKPNLNANTWNNQWNNEQYGIGPPYTWKIIKTNNISETIKNITVNIFPNPTTDFTTISFNLKKNCNLEINLFDITGKRIENIYSGFAEFGLFTQTINLSLLSNGIYFLQISDGKFSTVEKIVVN